MAINLLPQLKAGEIERLRRKKVFELLSVAALVITAIAVIAVFAFWAILGNEAAAVNNKIELTEVAVGKLIATESLFRGLKLKLSFLGQVLSARLPHSQTLEEIEKLLPEGVRISELLLDETGQVVLSAVAFSPADLGNTLGVFSEAETIAGRKIKKTAISSIVREKAGSYKFTLKLTLEEKTK